MAQGRTVSKATEGIGAALVDVVVLGGGGHVGLPLSLALADAGLRVGIYDINEDTLSRIGRGEMPFLENGADELLARCARQRPAGPRLLGRDDRPGADAVIVVIGTPVDEFLGPSMRVFERAVDQIAPHLRDGALVVLRSTVYPGTTEYVAAAFAERGRPGRRRLLPGADRGGPCARGADDAAPDRRRGHRGCRRSRGGAVRGGWRRRRSGRRAARPS